MEGPEMEAAREDDGEDEPADEVQRPVLRRLPRRPTQREKEEHESTGHAQYRNWCDVCAAARGVGSQHRARPDEDRRDDDDPEIVMDYCFIHDDSVQDGPEYMTVLVMKDQSYGSYGASAVKQKGADDDAVAYGKQFLLSQGHRRAILKSDGEPSIVAFKKALVEAVPSMELILKESPPYDHRANGAAELAVKEIKRQTRALVFDVSKRYGDRLTLANPLVFWAPRHAAAVLNRYRLGSDGMTAEVRRTGRSWRRPALQFGELVRFRRAGSAGGDLEERLHEGRYIGHHDKTGAVMLMTSDGVVFGMSVSQKDAHQRWSPEGLGDLKGLPWDRKRRLRRGAPDEPAREALPAGAVPEGLRSVPLAEQVPEQSQRSLYITKADVERYGATDHCPGCVSVFIHGSARVPHSRVCRDKMYRMMKEDELGRARLAAHAAKRSAPERGPDDDSRPSASARVDFEDAPPTGSDERRLDEPRLDLKRSSEADVDPSLSSPSRRVRSEVQGAKRESASAEESPRRRHRPVDPRGVKRPAEAPAEDAVEPAGGASSSSSTPAPAASSSSAPAASSSSAPAVVPPSASAPATLLNPEEWSTIEVCEKLSSFCTDARRVWMRIVDEASEQHMCAVADAVGIGGMTVERAEPHDIYGLQLGVGPGLVVDLTQEDVAGLAPREIQSRWKQGVPLLVYGVLVVHSDDAVQSLLTGPIDSGVFLEKSGDQVALMKAAASLGGAFLCEVPIAKNLKREELCLEDIFELRNLFWIDGLRCRWRSADGGRYVRRQSLLVTNSPEVAEKLHGAEVLQGDDVERSVLAIHRRARGLDDHPARVVLSVLCAAKAVVKSMEGVPIGSVEGSGSMPSPVVPPLPDVPLQGFWDDVNGGELPAHLVRAARAEELAWLHKMEVYQKVDIEQAWQETGKAPITLRWVDTNKGSRDHPVVRSRLVVRELKVKTPELTAAELFSAMPPLESLKVLVSLMATLKKSDEGDNLRMGFYDISRAHFYGRAQRRIYIQLPEEEREEGKCGLLLRTMYGTRDASRTWQGDYTELLEKGGFEHGRTSPATFYCERFGGIRALVHGDDFAVLASANGLAYVESLLDQRYEYKTTGVLGEGCEHNECLFLNRVIRCVEVEGGLQMEVEADARHAEVAVSDLSLEKGNSVSTPSVKVTAEQVEHDLTLDPLGPEQSTLYRSVLMRVSYLSQDRPDLAESVKTLSRRMVSPNAADFQRLKRVVRYLKKRPRLVLLYPPQDAVDAYVRVETDSDFAGDLLSRRSTSGTALFYGQHLLKATSHLQSTVSLSSGEAEYYACVQGAAVAIGIRSIMEDWKVSTRVELATDSSAARGLASRRGVGRVRHVATRYLWLQERLAKKELSIVSVPTSVNRADALTKPMTAPRLELLVRSMGSEYREGRSAAQKGSLLLRPANDA